MNRIGGRITRQSNAERSWGVRRAVATSASRGTNIDPRIVGVVLGLVLLGIAIAVVGAAPAAGAQTTHTHGGVAQADSGDLTEISGQVLYQHEDGSWQPARNVEVRILKNGAIDREIVTTTTDDNGRYSVNIDVAYWENSWFDEELNLKIQALARNPAADVFTLSNYAKIHKGNGGTYTRQVKDTVTVGADSKEINIYASEQDYSRAFQIADAALDAYRFSEEELSWTRDQVDVKYPAHIGGDMYASPFDTIRITTDGWQYDKDGTVTHEYGHATMGALFGYGDWEIPEIESWLKNDEGEWFPCHTYYSKTDKNYAWYEGFAEFFEAAASGYSAAGGYDLESTDFYTMDATHPECHDASGTDEYDGEEVEGSIASIFWDLYDGTGGEDFDNMDVELQEILGTISGWDGVTSDLEYKRNSEKALNINDFWDQFRTDENHADLRKIFLANGIQKPDQFENNDDTSSATAIEGGDTVEAQINSGDVDVFEIDVSDGDEVTVTIDRQVGDSDLELQVLGPNGNAVADSSTRGIADEEVSFTADASGTYYVEVSDRKEYTGGAYELSVENSGSSFDWSTVWDEPVYTEVTTDPVVVDTTYEIDLSSEDDDE